MKPCPRCGKNIPDYAKQCTYCDYLLPELPTRATEVQSAQSFACPTCGAPLTYAGEERVLVCSYCNNSVVIPETLRQTSAPQLTPKHSLQTLPKGERVLSSPNK